MKIKNALATLLLVQKIKTTPELSNIEFRKLNRPISLLNYSEISDSGFSEISNSGIAGDIKDFWDNIDLLAEHKLILKTNRFYAINYDGDRFEAEFDKNENCFYVNGYPVEEEDKDDYDFINEIELHPEFLSLIENTYNELIPNLMKIYFSFIYLGRNYKCPLFVYNFHNVLECLLYGNAELDIKDHLIDSVDMIEDKLEYISVLNINDILYFSEIIEDEIVVSWQDTLKLIK